MTEADIKIDNVSFYIKSKYLSFNVAYPSHPIEAVIYLLIAGFFFYFSPERAPYQLGFYSMTGIYLASLLFIFVFARRKSLFASCCKIFFTLGFFFSTAMIGFYFFQAFFAFLRQVIDFFYLDKTAINSIFLGAASITTLLWYGLVADKKKRQNIQTWN